MQFIDHFESYLAIDDQSSNAADWYSRDEGQNGVRPMNIFPQNGDPIVLHDDGDGKSTNDVIALSKGIEFDSSGPTNEIYSTVAKGF